MLTPLAIGTLAYSTPTQWSIWGLVTSIVTLLLAFDPREALSQGDALSFFVLLALYIVTYAMCASIRTIAIDASATAPRRRAGAVANTAGTSAGSHQIRANDP
ncbi:MAG: hypothetical protein ACLUA4_03970 [Bifidobacterium sp.]